MTLNALASKIAKLEGKKTQARIGEIREILKIQAGLMADEYIAEDSFDLYTDVEDVLREYAAKIAAKKKGKSA